MIDSNFIDWLIYSPDITNGYRFDKSKTDD